MRPDPRPVVALVAGEAASVVDVLVAAFAGYPALRYLLHGTPAAAVPGHRDALATLFGFFVAARFARGEGVLGIRDGRGWAAVALVSDPDRATPPGALDELRAATWATLGTAARARYEAMGLAWQRLAVAAPHLHLNLIGVRPDRQGAGLGRRLLDHVQALARAHPTAAGVALNTEVEANVAWYRRQGYTDVGDAEVAPGVRTWVLYRPHGGPDAAAFA